MAELTRRSLLTSSLAVGAGALGTTALGGTPAVARRDVPALVRTGVPALTHGVQAGDVGHTTGTVWARSDRPARLLVELSRDPSFRHPRRTRSGVVLPETDLTGKVRLRGLPPDTELFYRIRPQDPDTHATGEPVTGRLRTAPSRRRDVRFVWSGDIAGQGWGVNPDLGGFRMADVMIDLDPDFFLCSGDTVYADGPLAETVALPDGSTWRNLVVPEKTKVAETLDEYRGQYKYNLLADNWRTFLAATPQINQWDDHEVTNNWYPGEVLDDERYTEQRVDVLAARAHRAFFEYLPVEPTRPDRENRLYRTISYGPLLDVFVLDMRTHKDPNTDGTETVPDGGVLGHEQTEWLKHELRRSPAVWKVIAADLPLGLVVPDGDVLEGVANGRPGAPAGRELDIAPVLSFLKRHGIRNHVWLTADVHYTAAHHYSPERATFTDFDPFWEFVSGPLNAGAFGPNTLDPTFGPEAVFVEAPPAPNASPAEGYQFVGEVGIDGETAELTVRLVGVDGSIRWQTTLQPHER
ncbi:alkaline phosphatase D [Haloactinopolyspora alba]|uniref:Alkaline phosphatase D n=1 Tax=Haloactinopolyspora alba TaxID=648780 RepID=A0A2P8D2F2_9ACTN|nr:alkaline phosphatase D family protein [Haloactinopolyspora alba]PSK91404.1 alkaline phosphatase D [Haloactinopolyspora alba]